MARKKTPHVREASPGTRTLFLSIHLPYLLHMIPCSYRASTCMAVLPSCSAFMISVRQARDLPPASFRSHLAVGTLALGYILPATGRIRDFHPLERAPAGRTMKKRPRKRSCLFTFKFRVGCVLIGSPQQIINAGFKLVRQPVRQFQRKRPLSPLIFGVQALVAQHVFRHLLLFQIPVFPQIPDTQLHNITRVQYILVHIVLFHYWTICPKIS